ncbi:MAG: hypothetical protein ABIL68_01535 [bacterium]
MKRLTFLSIISIFSSAFFAEMAYSLPWPPDMDVYYIKFNYESGHTWDALTIKKNKTTPISVPEWESGGSTNEKFAYIKSQSYRKIKAQFWIDRNWDDHMEAYAEKNGGGQGIGDISQVYIDFNGTQYSDETLMSFDGSVPSSIDTAGFNLKWYGVMAEGPDEDLIFHFGTTGRHKYYIVLDTPQAPMSEPWTGVLDYSCDWASGLSSDATVIDSISHSIYSDLGLAYDIYSQGSGYAWYDAGNYYFDLEDFLDEVPGEDLRANCWDTGMSVTIFANALGCNAECKSSTPFGWVNCIKPIGRGWTNNPFYPTMSYPYNDPIEDGDTSSRSKFSTHVVTVLSSIYDACLKVDTDADPDGAPHTESWANGWSWNTYVSKVVDNNPSTSTGALVLINFSIQSID